VKKGARRKTNAKKNKRLRVRGRRKNPAFSIAEVKLPNPVILDLALAMLRVLGNHGLIPVPEPSNLKDFKAPPFAGGKAN